MRNRLVDIYRVDLNSRTVRNKRVFDFSCFRSSTEHWVTPKNHIDPILVAVTFHEYVLQPDENNFQGKKETIYHLTDIIDTVDCRWIEENPTYIADGITPPAEMIASENADGTNQNHVFFDKEGTEFTPMSDGEIGTMEQQVRFQLIQVLMLTVKNPIIRPMIKLIMGWYKTEYDEFLQMGEDTMLDKMQEDIDNNVTERTDVLLFKPFESIEGHPVQHNTIFDNVKARFDAYKNFLSENA